MNFFSRKSPASKWKLVLHGIGGLALIVFSCLILLEATKATVVIAQNGEKQTVKTHSNTVEDLLEELNIDFNQHDAISYSLDTKITNGMTIDYKQAKQLTVMVDDDKNETYYTTEDTVGNFIEQEGISVSKHDELSHHLDTPIEDGLQLAINTAFEVVVDDGGEEKSLWTTADSVAELLEEQKIKLNKEDKIKPSKKKSLKDDMHIAITRVEKVKDTVEEAIAFEVEEKKDDSLAKGKEKILSEGEDGLVVKKYEITKENGKEVGRKLVDEKTEKESKAKVVAVGTKEAESQLTTLSSNNSNHSNHSSSDESSSGDSKPEGGKEFYVDATAFTSDCSGCSGYTATGINLKENPNKKVIAVDPNVIPLGSKVWVEGYGYAIAGDTGGSIKGNRIDAHVPTKQDAYNFGKKKVKVRIVD